MTVWAVSCVLYDSSEKEPDNQLNNQATNQPV